MKINVLVNHGSGYSKEAEIVAPSKSSARAKVRAYVARHFCDAVVTFEDVAEDFAIARVAFEDVTPTFDPYFPHEARA